MLGFNHEATDLNSTVWRWYLRILRETDKNCGEAVQRLIVYSTNPLSVYTTAPPSYSMNTAALRQMDAKTSEVFWMTDQLARTSHQAVWGDSCSPSHETPILLRNPNVHPPPPMQWT